MNVRDAAVLLALALGAVGTAACGGGVSGAAPACGTCAAEADTVARCDGARALQRCQRDGNGCWNWTDESVCSTGYACSTTPYASCRSTCSTWHECAPSETRCAKFGVKACTLNASGCLEWSAPAECPAGSACDRATDACTGIPCSIADVDDSGEYPSWLACGLLSSGGVKCFPGTLQAATNIWDALGTDNAAIAMTRTSALSGIESTICALKANGSVWCNGSNDSGQLGNSSTVVEVTVPVRVTGLSGVTSLAGSRNVSAYFCAGTSTGEVWCWGHGYGSAPVKRNTLKPAAAVLPRGPSLSILLADGTLQYGSALVSGVDSSVVDYFGATGNTNLSEFLLKTDGTVWARGKNDRGQVGDGTTSTLATTAWSQVPGLSGVMAIAPSPDGYPSSGDSICALRTDGTLWCWGNNEVWHWWLGEPYSTSPTQIPFVGNSVAELRAGLLKRKDGTWWRPDTYPGGERHLDDDEFQPLLCQ